MACRYDFPPSRKVFWLTWSRTWFLWVFANFALLQLQDLCNYTFHIRLSFSILIQISLFVLLGSFVCLLLIALSFFWIFKVSPTPTQCNTIRLLLCVLLVFTLASFKYAFWTFEWLVHYFVISKCFFSLLWSLQTKNSITVERNLLV